MASWPSTLPAPALTGYQFAPDTTTIKTDMDSGPARVRRRFTSASTQYQATWILNAIQLATFESWFVLDALSGAAWFTVNQWNGLGRGTMTARISSGTYTAALVAPAVWQVTAALEVRDRPIMNSTALAPYL